MIHTRSHRRDDRHVLPLCKCLQDRNPLLFEQVAVDIRLKKDQILGRKIQDIPVEKAIVFVQFPCTQITVRDDKPAVIPLCRTGNKMRFLRINTAAHLKHAVVGTDLP